MSVASRDLGRARFRPSTANSATSWSVPRSAVRLVRFLMVGALVMLAIGGFQLVSPARAHAATGYTSGSIADVALTFVGKNGGEACAKAHTGDSGGECRAFVNCVVWLASNGTQNLGKYSTSYFKALEEFGDPVTGIDSLQKGDIVQIGSGVHTFIIISHLSGNTFHVVDSNSLPDDEPQMVREYDRENVTLGGSTRAFRMHGASAGNSSREDESSPSGSGKPSTKSVDPRHTSTMNKDTRIWASPNSAGNHLVFARNGSTVSMQCWDTGAEQDGTSKWFKIRVEGDSYDEGYVPANAVDGQWRSSPRC